MFSQVEYTCANETLVLDGESTRSCLYSGKWSGEPKCVSKSKDNAFILVIAILIVVVIPFALLISIVLWFKLRKQRIRHCLPETENLTPLFVMMKLMPILPMTQSSLIGEKTCFSV